MGKKSYSQAEREHAVALTRAMSYLEAAGKSGIPAGTIAYWVHVAKKTQGGKPEEVAPAEPVVGAAQPAADIDQVEEGGGPSVSAAKATPEPDLHCHLRPDRRIRRPPVDRYGDRNSVRAMVVTSRSQCGPGHN